MERKGEKELGRKTYPRERESFRFLLPLLLDPKLKERERQNLREIGREMRCIIEGMDWAPFIVK
jgi:hypothetical protein